MPERRLLIGRGGARNLFQRSAGVSPAAVSPDMAVQNLPDAGWTGHVLRLGQPRSGAAVCHRSELGALASCRRVDVRFCETRRLEASGPSGNRSPCFPPFPRFAPVKIRGRGGGETFPNQDTTKFVSALTASLGSARMPCKIRIL